MDRQVTMTLSHLRQLMEAATTGDQYAMRSLEAHAVAALPALLRIAEAAATFCNPDCDDDVDQNYATLEAAVQAITPPPRASSGEGQ
jgi:hypothetical protein